MPSVAVVALSSDSIRTGSMSPNVTVRFSSLSVLDKWDALSQSIKSPESSSSASRRSNNILGPSVASDAPASFGASTRSDLVSACKSQTSRRSSPAQANFRSSFHSYRGPTCVDDVPVSTTGLSAHSIDVSFSCSAVFILRALVTRLLSIFKFNLQSSIPNGPQQLVRGPRDEDMLNTRMENGRVGVARSTVDMHRVRVRNRASVGATVARRAYSPAPICA
ncbi:hypothetical protein EVAR_77956_1, partial [Eumeta japonica]